MNDCKFLGDDGECTICACGWNYCFVEDGEDPEIGCSEYEGANE